MRAAKRLAIGVLRTLGMRITPRWASSPTYGAPGLAAGQMMPPPWAVTRTSLRRAAAGKALLTCDARPSHHFPGNRANVYGIDRSGTVEYHFNSAGYRSEELDLQAEFRLCVIGESHALGTGVPFERTVGQRLKVHLAAALDLPETSVNAVNLSVGGASADYCIRTLIRQIDIVRPHLVYLNMPAVDRIEDYSQDQGRCYTISGVDLDRIEEMPEPIQGFFDLYNPHLGRMNQVKNALMFQMACHIRGVEHVIGSHELWPEQFATPILKPIYDQLDLDRIMLNKFLQKRPDVGADGSHAGPRSHEAMAIAILERYARLVQQSEGTQDATRLRAHVDRLKEESDDWAFALDVIGRGRRAKRPVEA